MRDILQSRYLRSKSSAQTIGANVLKMTKLKTCRKLYTSILLIFLAPSFFNRIRLIM